MDQDRGDSRPDSLGTDADHGEVPCFGARTVRDRGRGISAPASLLADEAEQGSLRTASRLRRIA